MEESTQLSTNEVTASEHPDATSLNPSATSTAISTNKKSKKKKVNGLNKKKNKKKSNQAIKPKERPRKSLIRKRPVSFGNPALGTYHGSLYTLDVVGEDYSPLNRPILEGCESVERIVAMVDVPPEQVPEGILNLARSHRPYIHHVRIVIGEPGSEDTTTTAANSNAIKVSGEEEKIIEIEGHEETKDEVSFENNSDGYDNTQTNQLSQGPLEAVSTVENAASILAADEVQAQENESLARSKARQDLPMESLLEKEKSDDNFSDQSRTYLILLELCSVDAAEAFVEDLHGKPYTSLDPSQTTSVYQVLALTGEDGVSLLSPFFAPTAKTASPKAAAVLSSEATATTSEEGPKSTSAATKNTKATKKNKTTAPKSAASKSSDKGHSTVSAPAPVVVEDYNCAVCLEHMDLTESIEDSDNTAHSSILTTVCNHTFHLDCLLQWQDSPCPVCRYDHSGLNEALSQCNACGTTENNYVCLICGVVSCGGPPVRSTIVGSTVVGTASRSSPVCGIPAASLHGGSDGNFNDSDHSEAPPPMETSQQLSQSHARKHYDETLHAYALDTETQHVWDFAGQGYVHRLLQNKEDGKLVEYHDPSNTSSHERSLNPGLSEAQEGEVLHRKLEGFASQYYTLLKSQLEQQRIYYEGRLEELRRESLLRKKAQTSDLINALKQEKAQLSKRLGTLKARHSKVVEDVAFLKNMNESLEANKEPLKRKIKEAQRRRLEARDQLQECLPVLEEKVTMLMLQLTGEDLPADEATMGSNDGAASAAASLPTEDVECAPPQPAQKDFKRSDSSQSDDKKPAARR